MRRAGPLVQLYTSLSHPHTAFTVVSHAPPSLETNSFQLIHPILRLSFIGYLTYMDSFILADGGPYHTTLAVLIQERISSPCTTKVGLLCLSACSSRHRLRLAGMLVIWTQPRSDCNCKCRACNICMYVCMCG